MILKIDITKVQHPYPDEPSSLGENWHKIKIYVTNKGDIIKELIVLQWDIIVLKEWLIENESAIFNEFLPDFIKGSSIANGIANFYEFVDPDDDIIDVVYEYRLRHSFRFALRGTDIDEIYIGLNKEKLMTVSCCKPNDSWAYPVEVDGFFDKIHKII